MIKKIFFALFLGLLFCNTTFAESYYFKECQLSENAYGDYLIDFDKQEIKVSLKAIDGSHQELADKIELVTKDKVVSERIQNKIKKNYYLQYELNAVSKSIIRQHYKKESGIDLIRPFGPKKENYCANVKADWNKKKTKKTEVSKEEKEILTTQEQILKKQSSIPKCQGNDYKQWTNCKGSYFNEIGYKYVGEFKNGKILEGIATYPGGTKYLGQFKDDEPHGRGTFLYSNGTKYYGEWKNGKNHGNGTKMWNDGRKYVGEFKDDKPHGQGTFTYVDGNTFTGKFVAGSEHGKGHCTNQDGSIIECKVQKNENTKNFGGKVRRNISIVARKWVNLSEYNSFSDKAKKVMKKLESDFKIRASELCSTNGKFNILTKRIELLDMDETPAFGLEPKVQLGIKGSVECI